MLDKIKSNFYIVILIFCFLFVTYPLFHGGFFPTMDDVQVVRVDEMAKELLVGQFPVRMIHNLGFGAGSLLFNFYGTLAYYIGGLFHIFGISLVRSTKFVFIAGYLIGSLGIYLLIRKYADKLTGVIAVLLFLTASYLNYDVYVRGSLGEFFGFILVPLLFWSFLRLKDTRTFTAIAIAGIILGASIMSHPIIAVVGCGFLLLLIIVLPFQKERIIASGAALILGLCLGAFSWIPVAFEQQYLNLTTNSYATGQYITNFLTPLQIAGIMKIPWGFKTPILGIGLFVGAFLGMGVLFLKKRKQKRIILFASISFFFSLFMIASISKPLWDASTYIKLLQFPWRYLVIATVSSIMLCSVFLTNIKKVWLRIILGFILLLPAITLQYSYLRPSNYNYIAAYTADDVCNTSTWAQEYLPKWVKSCITKKTNVPIVAVSKGIRLLTTSQVHGGREITAQTTGDKGTIIFRKYYFPGWNIYVDGNKVRSYPTTKYGLLGADIPKGQHVILTKFENTWDIWVGNIVTLVAILLVLCCAAYQLHKKYSHLYLA